MYTIQFMNSLIQFGYNNLHVIILTVLGMITLFGAIIKFNILGIQTKLTDYYYSYITSPESVEELNELFGIKRNPNCNKEVKKLVETFDNEFGEMAKTRKNNGIDHTKNTASTEENKKHKTVFYEECSGNTCQLRKKSNKKSNSL